MLGLVAGLSACAEDEPDRLELRVRAAEGLAAAESLLIYVRDDGPPRAVGAGVYQPPPADAEASTQRISIQPDGPFVGQVSIYVLGCASTATCLDDRATAPDCRCDRPLSFGAAVTKVSGRTRVDVRLTAWRPACDGDGDGVIGCALDPTCCASLAADARAAVADCEDAASEAHPFRPSEPSAEDVQRDRALADRNAAFCGDGLDNDCAGSEDTTCAQLDADGDGYTPPDDCDDHRPFIHPDQPDDCKNAFDDDCDGIVAVCDTDGDGAAGPLDCDDDDPARYFGAPDACGDGVDQDCDGVDLPCISEDLDGDGYACPGAAPGGDHRCDAPGADCDDLDAATHPGAPEPCHDPTKPPAPDRNCDGRVPDCPGDDQDGDGARPRSAGGADCDDHDPDRFPGAPEACNDGVDQDCDGADQPCAGVQDEDGDHWPAGADCNDREAAVRPGAEELCNGLDDDCDGVVDEGNPLRLQAGAQAAAPRCGDDCPGESPCGCYSAPNVCTPDPVDPSRKIVLCIGIPAGRFGDVCNGSDDDCDGTIDGLGGARMTMDCYSGPEATEGVGACHGGTSTCVSEPGAGMAVWSGCADEVVPTEEVCNDADDDCDGARNEDAAGEAIERSCYPDEWRGTPGLGPCREGLETCGPGGWEGCQGAVGPSEEVCNGGDDDCDGAVDTERGGAPLTRDCYEGPRGTEGRGICRGGTATCVGGSYVGCMGQRLPETETCDDRDEDCDGRVDEGLQQACGSNIGVCRPGVSTCDRGEWGGCMGDVRPGTEICNNLDDDCDGHADDGLTRVCGIDTGACATGMETCAAGAWGACVGAVGPVNEVCNGVDDNCDGATDENLDMQCQTGLPAPCGTGRQLCRNGSYTACAPVETNADELCDGLDNDCDGEIDEGWNVGEACNVGRGACRRPGVRVCSGTVATICNGTPGMEQPETCNGVDDNCDGTVDEGMDMACTPSGDRCGGMQGCRCGNGAPCAGGAACMAGACP